MHIETQVVAKSVREEAVCEFLGYGSVDIGGDQTKLDKPLDNLSGGGFVSFGEDYSRLEVLGSLEVGFQA